MKILISFFFFNFSKKRKLDFIIRGSKGTFNFRFKMKFFEGETPTLRDVSFLIFF